MSVVFNDNIVFDYNDFICLFDGGEMVCNY